MTTPVIKWLDTGLVAPKEPDILTGRLNDLNDAFGGNLNVTNLETPQGQIASSETVIIGEMNDAIMNLANQVDPRFASGFMQDAIGQIYFIQRKPARSTTVQVICAGAVDEIIPAGAQVKDDNGEVYRNLGDAQIGLGGTVTATFENVNPGAIPVTAGTVNRIYDRLGAFGWESVSNAVDGVLGADVESRADFEARRNASVFLGSENSLDAAYSAVFNITNVSDVFATQNLTASPITVGSTSYTINPAEVFICVKGGTDKAVAEAIYSKVIGTTLIGNTTVNVISAISGQSNPITFNRPSAYTIKVAVNIANSTLLPGNTEDLVKQAVIDAFNGADGGEKARIGSTIYASRFYAPIATLDKNIRLISVFVGNSTANLTSIGVGIDQYPSLSISNITVNLI